MEQGGVWDWVGDRLKGNDGARRPLDWVLNPMNGVNGAKGTRLGIEPCEG